MPWPRCAPLALKLGLCITVGWLNGCGAGSLVARKQSCQSGNVQDCSSADVLDLDKACSGGKPEGCAALGLLYEEGRVVGKDERRAVTLFALACEAGNALACERYYGKSCEHGLSAPCASQGVCLVQHGRVVRRPGL